jgi:hypothetical protein
MNRANDDGFNLAKESIIYRWLLAKAQQKIAALFAYSSDDSRKINPQVPEVVILTEDDLAVTTGHGIPENVAVTAPFEHGHGNPKVGDLVAFGMVAEHLGHLSSAKAEETAIVCYRPWADRRQHGPGQRLTEPVLFIE